MTVATQPTTQNKQALLTMTDRAEDVVRRLLDEKNIPGYALRVFVQGGGCSGYQYGMAFEKEPRPDDQVVEISDDVRIVVDPMSMNHLAGIQIDYAENLMGGGFSIENPNAVSSCGCGHSFRTSGADSAAAGAGGGGCC